MADMSPSPQEKLKALREHFARLLPEKVARSLELWTAVLESSEPEETAIELARHFHTLVVDRIPRLEADERDAARRFITLVDALYDLKVKLIASADAEPAELYQAAEGAEAFEFARCASRLIEMRSADYLAEPHGAPSMRDLDGVVET